MRRRRLRRPAAVLATAAAAAVLTGVATAPAGAFAPREYRTTVEAKDDTEFTVREGPQNDRCASWSRAEGHLVTTIKPQQNGVMTLLDPPGPVGLLLSHSFLRSGAASRLRTTGTEHPAFPCGCGPSSELGECPPAQADEKLNGNCGRSGRGSLSLVLRKGRLLALVGAPIGSLLEDCPLAVPELLPDDVGLPDDLPLPASALRAIRRLKPGAETEVRESYRHAGRRRGCPRRTIDKRESVCSVLTFTMTVRRVS